MPYNIYFFSFQEDYSFPLQDQLSKALKKLPFKPVFSHRKEGLLLLLRKEEKTELLNYLKAIDKELTRKSFDLAEVEEVINNLGYEGRYTVQLIDATLEYVFWVSKNHHSDIILRSTKENLHEAFCELQQNLTDKHPYIDYDLTNIHLHYKTTKGYIGTGEKYQLRTPIRMNNLLTPKEIELLNYL